ncbi:MAG TPA: hypothetical protein VGK16_10075 [Candidatus Limnocylindrales bacterium]|jgi:hypothetical protein
MNRRKLLTAGATAMLVAGTLVWGGIALASTTTSLFELEGNAVVDHAGTAKPDDWATVYGGTANTDVTSFVDDRAISVDCATGGNNCSIFTGGGSKDPQKISQWAWKTDTGGLPDKDNLQHGFAARYSLPSSTECPGPVGDISGTTKCEMLFFGNDRFDNSGDAQQGFWFFQDAVAPNADGSFAGVHINGDLLLISDFSIGGTVSTITVYTWDDTCLKASGNTPAVGTCGDANLRVAATSTSAKCSSAVDPALTGFCGIVNPANGTVSPWPFVDKTTINATTHPANTFLQGEFYEGGVNLSYLNLQNECFASVASETRSSQSTTATLKDFVLGSFGHCDSGIVTTPQTGAGGTMTDHSNPANGVIDVSIGTGTTSVRDHAVVTVPNAATWVGSVQFSLCGPLALGSTSNCQAGGVAIGSPVAVSNTTPTADSAATTLSKVGRYCWRGDFTSTTTGVSSSHDPNNATSVTECFEVLPVKPTLATQASGAVAVGGTVSDTATISGTANGPGSGGLGVGGTINPTTPGAPAGGNITWKAYGPNDCSTVALDSTSRLISGDGTYPTNAQSTVSFTATAAGTYTFVASYAGDSPNTLGVAESACPDKTGTETVTVGSSGIVTTPQKGNGDAMTDNSDPANGVIDVSIGTGTVSVRDHAVVSVSGFTTWAGSVQFSLCGPLALGSTSNCQTGGVAIGSPVAVSNASTAANSPATTLSKVGRYCWRGDFTATTTGVPNSHDPNDATSVSECFEVLPVQPTLTTQASADVILGNPISDTATISGTATGPGSGGLGTGGTINPTTPGAPAGGTITWTAYGPGDCSTVAMAATSRTVSGNGTYPTVSQTGVSFTPLSLGTYTFVASYSGDSPNTLSIGNSACPDASSKESVDVTGTSSLSTAQDWLPNDTATLTGDANLNGSLTFTLYNDNTCGTTGGTDQYHVTQTIANATSGSTFSTNNTTVKATATGDWSWKVSYTDNNLTSPSDSCEKTSITINN